MNSATIDAPPERLSRWRPSPARALSLFFGLALFGAGEALLVASTLGASPWSVFADGVAKQTGLSIGMVTNLIGACVLACWIPLRQRPGLGTIANVLIVGTAMDVTLRVTGYADSTPTGLVAVFAGIGLVAVGSGFYLGAGLGPGPRDGLMTGLHRTTGRSLRLMRFCVEVAVLALGILLGGTFGIGTILFALLIGPAVQLTVRALGRVPTSEL